MDMTCEACANAAKKVLGKKGREFISFWVHSSNIFYLCNQTCLTSWLSCVAKTLTSDITCRFFNPIFSDLPGL